MDFHNIILNFTGIIYEALPFVVLGVVIAGVLEEFVPQQIISGIFDGDATLATRSSLPALLRPAASLLRFRIAAIALGGLLGLVFPMCECGIIAVMRRLIRKGVPLSVCICYMLAGPIINVVVILSTYVAFNFPRAEDWLFPLDESNPLAGPQMVVLLRVGLGFVVAFVTSVVVDREYRRHGAALLQPALIIPSGKRNQQEVDTEAPVRTPYLTRLGNIAETALHDFIDIMAFLVLGAGLAAVGRESIDGSDFQSLVQGSPVLAILMMMGIAVLFCLCSEADAFVAANFAASLPPASKIAFLVLGPMFDLKLYVMFTRIFRQRLIWTIVLCVVVQVLVYCTLLHFLWPGNGFPTRMSISQSP